MRRPVDHVAALDRRHIDRRTRRIDSGEGTAALAERNCGVGLASSIRPDRNVPEIGDEPGRPSLVRLGKLNVEGVDPRHRSCYPSAGAITTRCGALGADGTPALRWQCHKDMVFANLIEETGGPDDSRKSCSDPARTLIPDAAARCGAGRRIQRSQVDLQLLIGVEYEPIDLPRDPDRPRSVPSPAEVFALAKHNGAS